MSTGNVNKFSLAPIVLDESTFEELFATSERAAVIVACAIIEDDLRGRIAEILAPCERRDDDPLFDGGNAPLGTFSAKTHLADRMGITGPVVAQHYHRLRKVRNEYAHKATGHEDACRQMLDDMLRSYFTIQGKLSAHEWTVSLSCNLQGSPIEKMIKAKTQPHLLACRLMLVGLVGQLGRGDPNTTGALSIKCDVTRGEKTRIDFAIKQA